MEQHNLQPKRDQNGQIQKRYTACLLGGAIGDALGAARTLLVAERGHEETLAALDKAIALSQSGKPHHIAIQELGEGWVVEEALAISVYCAWWRRPSSRVLCWR